MNWDKKAPALTGQTWKHRVTTSVLLLVVHGFLTEKERERVMGRIIKAYRKDHPEAP